MMNKSIFNRLFIIWSFNLLLEENHCKMNVKKVIHMKFKTENIISFMIAIALLVDSLNNFIIKKENGSFINIIIAILFIIFELIRVKYNKNE